MKQMPTNSIFMLPRSLISNILCHVQVLQEISRHPQCVKFISDKTSTLPINPKLINDSPISQRDRPLRTLDWKKLTNHRPWISDLEHPYYMMTPRHQQATPEFWVYSIIVTCYVSLEHHTTAIQQQIQQQIYADSLFICINASIWHHSLKQ